MQIDNKNTPRFLFSFSDSQSDRDSVSVATSSVASDSTVNGPIHSDIEIAAETQAKTLKEKIKRLFCCR